VDRGDAEAEPRGDGRDRQEALGPQELRPPQIRRNLLRGRASIRSIGWIWWQGFVEVSVERGPGSPGSPNGHRQCAPSGPSCLGKTIGPSDQSVLRQFEMR